MSGEARHLPETAKSGMRLSRGDQNAAERTSEEAGEKRMEKKSLIHWGSGFSLAVLLYY